MFAYFICERPGADPPDFVTGAEDLEFIALEI